MPAPSDLSPDGSPSAEVCLSQLSHGHLNMLRAGSAISDEVIAARGYRTVNTSAEVSALGFANCQCRAPALVLPVHTPGGEQPLCVLRPDFPRVHEDRGKGRLPDGTYPQKVLKYEFPKGAAMRVDCPPLCRPRLGDPATPLWITEGQKKADALASVGLCAIALLGVWNFKGRNEFGGTTVLADFDYIAWKDRAVRIVFDSDVMAKPAVQSALKHLTGVLRNKGARVDQVYLPPLDDGGKQGVDDYLASGHTVEHLERLVEAPRPARAPAAPLVELLDRPPEFMTRPIALVEGRAYAATWLPAWVTETEISGRNGEVLRLDAPKRRYDRRLVIVRDDGRRFSDDCPADAKLAGLGFEVNLRKVPAETLTWGAPGVTAYCAARRPSPVKLFRKLAEVADTFVDFGMSLADQQTMCELTACIIMSSYFLPAFTVIGFVWINGDRGSGKSHLGDVISGTAYLGFSLAANTSLAVMRDLADHGAAMAIDEAESLADAHKADPDKRALLLASNRRGAYAIVKEPDADRGWKIRRVNTFCQRVFTAIRLPDPVFASRCIVIPVVRTPERRRANADPLDSRLWPHQRVALVDELWAVALAHLPKMADYESRVNELATLTGRNLEPWRAIEAVALWLQEQAEPGSREADLFGRLDRLSVAYQAERAAFEPTDVKTVCLRALDRLFGQAAPGASALCASATEVSAAMRQVIREDDLDINECELAPARVGRILRQMRLQYGRRGGTGSRSWTVSRAILDRSLEAYGLRVTTGDGRASPVASSEAPAGDEMADSPAR